MTTTTTTAEHPAASPAPRSRRPRARRWTSVALVVTAVVAAGGWYRTAHPADVGFDTCRVVGDQVLLLDYTYGGGDVVGTRVAQTPDAIVVGFHLDTPGGTRTAIAHHGRLEHVLTAPLGDRPVRTEDGDLLTCTPLPRMPRT